MLARRVILLDTNFLLLPAQFRVDIYEEIRRVVDFPYELAVFEQTRRELEQVARGAQVAMKDKAAAKLALTVLANGAVRVLGGDDDGLGGAPGSRALSVNVRSGDAHAHVDDLIVHWVDRHPGTVVATNDLALIRRLKAGHVPVIRLRQKKYLVLER